MDITKFFSLFSHWFYSIQFSYFHLFFPTCLHQIPIFWVTQSRNKTYIPHNLGSAEPPFTFTPLFLLMEPWPIIIIFSYNLDPGSIGQWCCLSFIPVSLIFYFFKFFPVSVVPVFAMYCRTIVFSLPMLGKFCRDMIFLLLPALPIWYPWFHIAGVFHLIVYCLPKRKFESNWHIDVLIFQCS